MKLFVFDNIELLELRLHIRFVLHYQIGRTVSAVSVEDLRPQLLALSPILLAEASLPLHLLSQLPATSHVLLLSHPHEPSRNSSRILSKFSAKDRTKSVVDSLRSVGARVEYLKQYGEQVFTTRIQSEGRALELVTAINGDFTIPVRKHGLEDHYTKLMNIHIYGNIESAKHVIKDVRKYLKLIGSRPKTL
jgi:hypothetical protein